MSFRLKTILGVALIEAALLSLLVYEALFLLSESNAQAIEYRAQESAEQFSAAIKDALLSHDLATLETFSSQILESKGVTYTRIIDHDDKVIAQSGNMEILRHPFVVDHAIAEVNDGIYDVEARIIEGDILYGRVQLGISIENYESTMADAKQKTVAIALVEMTLVAFFSLVLGTYLTRQLQLLREGASRLARGELGTSIVVTGKDEIAETATAFNQMSADLLQSHQDNVGQSELLRDLLDTSSDFFWQTDEKLLIKFISVDYIAALDLETKNLLGLTLWGFLESQRYSTNMAVDSIKSLLTSRKEFSDVHLEIQSSNGDTKYFSLTGKPAFNERQEFIEYRGTGREITKYVLQEEELKTAKDLAEASNTAKSLFLATMSHELRTPLNGILGLSSILEETELDKDQMELVGSINSSGQALFRLITDILDITKIETGAVELVLEPFSLTDLIGQMVALFSDKAAASRNEITYSVEPERTVMLMGDIVRLKQILANLIGNAVKFCSDSLVRVDVRFESREDFETFLVVSVQDNGPGIAEEYRETIFDAFTQVDSSPVRSFGGTGLGLNMVRKLVTLMDGIVGLESELEAGSKFWFEIPMREIESGTSSSS